MELKNESLSIKSYQLKWLLKVFTSLGLVFFCFTTLQRFLTLMNRKKRLFNGKTSINKQPCSDILVVGLFSSATRQLSFSLSQINKFNVQKYKNEE